MVHLIPELNGFQVMNPDPKISGLSPAIGYTTGTTTVTISGSKFVSGAGIALVNASTEILGSVSSLKDSKIIGTFLLTNITPGTYNLTVTNPGGPNATRSFSVQAPDLTPEITEFSPKSGVNTAALPITITGREFRKGATIILMNGSISKSVAGTLNGSTMIKAPLPLKDLPYGLYNLTVTNTDGSSDTRPNGFQVMNPEPKISGITPSTGYTTGTNNSHHQWVKVCPRSCYCIS